MKSQVLKRSKDCEFLIFSVHLHNLIIFFYCLGELLHAKFVDPIALWLLLITMSRTPFISLRRRRNLICLSRTVSRKNFTTVESFIEEPDSRAQCAALEDNVKEFGLTYFGMKDRRQGSLSFVDFDVNLPIPNL